MTTARNMAKKLAPAPEELHANLQRLSELRRSASLPDAPEDATADDLTWLYSFTYEGERLSGDEIAAIVRFTREGLFGNRSKTSRVDSQFRAFAEYCARPVVAAAMHRMTEHHLRQWEMNAGKVCRQLFSIVTANVTDVCDVTATGIRLKTLSDLPRHMTDAVQEIHETRNAQGTQLRIKFYDKVAAAGLALRLLDAMPKETLKVEVEGLERLLETALRRSDLKGEYEVCDGD
jgi:hypothetical protein